METAEPPDEAASEPPLRRPREAAAVAFLGGIMLDDELDAAEAWAAANTPPPSSSPSPAPSPPGVRSLGPLTAPPASAEPADDAKSVASVNDVAAGTSGPSLPAPADRTYRYVAPASLTAFFRAAASAAPASAVDPDAAASSRSLLVGRTLSHRRHGSAGSAISLGSTGVADQERTAPLTDEIQTAAFDGRLADLRVLVTAGRGGPVGVLSVAAYRPNGVRGNAATLPLGAQQELWPELSAMRLTGAGRLHAGAGFRALPAETAGSGAQSLGISAAVATSTTSPLTRRASQQSDGAAVEDAAVPAGRSLAQPFAAVSLMRFLEPAGTLEPAAGPTQYAIPLAHAGVAGVSGTAGSAMVSALGHASERPWSRRKRWASGSPGPGDSATRLVSRGASDAGLLSASGRGGSAAFGPLLLTGSSAQSLATPGSASGRSRRRGIVSNGRTRLERVERAWGDQESSQVTASGAPSDDASSSARASASGGDDSADSVADGVRRAGALADHVEVDYDPSFLDNPDLRTGKHRTVVTLPFYLGSLLHHTQPSVLKRELNEFFRQSHPTVHPSLTLSQIRSVKRRLVSIALQEDMELSSVAIAIVYFEKLALRGLVRKDNRRLVAAVCLLLASKINDPKELDQGKVVKAAHKHLDVPPKAVYRHEVTVWSALEFSLYVPTCEVFPHLERVLAAADFDTLKEYYGENAFYLGGC